MSAQPNVGRRQKKAIIFLLTSALYLKPIAHAHENRVGSPDHTLIGNKLTGNFEGAIDLTRGKCVAVDSVRRQSCAI